MISSRHFSLAAMILTAWLSSASSFALDVPVAFPKGYICHRPSSPIVIDGKLDERAWNEVPYTDDFVDIEGDARPRPRFRTRAKMLWDDTYFYVAAELEEPHVWGTLTKHDSVIFQDNDFEIFIDPDGDHHEYYEIELNALNTEWDLLLDAPYRNGGPARNTWEIPGLKTAVHIDGSLNDPSDVDRSWTVEFAIPWTVLAEFAHRPAPPGNGDQWRLNFSRVEWQVDVNGKTTRKVQGKKEDNWVWSPQGAIDMHRPETWGYVQFTTEEPGKATFRRDASVPIRERLMRIYHAEQAYFGEHHRFTDSLAALNLLDEADKPKTSAPKIQITAKGFEASIDDDAPKPRTYRVRENSRLSVSNER